MELEEKRKAFAYVRVSGKSQIEGDGFRRQQDAIKAYAAANGFRVVKVFREEGVSGAKELSNRPALQALLAAIYSSRGTEHVLIEKLDRLARDLIVQETLIAEMEKHNIRVVSATEPDLCSGDPSRKLVRQVFGAISEYERAMIVLKLRLARERVRASTGRCEGRKPFGSRAGELKVIERMRELRAEGTPLQKIAERLNCENRPTRNGKQWYAASVGRILKAGCNLQVH